MSPTRILPTTLPNTVFKVSNLRPHQLVTPPTPSSSIRTGVSLSPPPTSPPLSPTSPPPTSAFPTLVSGMNPSPLPFVGDGTLPTDKQTISNFKEVDLFLQDSVGSEGDIGYDDEDVPGRFVNIRMLILMMAMSPPIGPNCPCGGHPFVAHASWWEQAKAVHSNHITADALIGALATPHIDATSPSLNVCAWVKEIASYLQHPHYVNLGGGSIGETIARCHSISHQQTGSSFVAMLTYMQLAIQCQSFINTYKERSSIRWVYDNHVAQLPNAPAQNTFNRWNAIGCKFISLATGGSIYILVLIAGLDMRWKIATLGGRIPWEVGKMLRQPETCKTPILILQHIIPAIAWIRSHLPLSLEKNCTNLSVTDKVLDAFKQNNYILPPRHFDSWMDCTTAVVEAMIVIRGDGHISMDHRVNPSYSSYTIRTVDQALHGIPEERVRAEAGVVIQDLDDLRDKLDQRYANGSSEDTDTYLRIPMDAFQGALDLRNADDSLMAFICPTLPESIRSNLLSSFLACFDGNEVLHVQKLKDDFHADDCQDQDTQIKHHEGVTLEKVAEKVLESSFHCLHFSIWNRYATKGDQAPTDIHPHYMSREDVSWTNHSQTLPYQSRDILEHQQLYDNILLAFGELFEWIDDVIKKCLPTEYEVLVELAQDLPGGEVSPVMPFLSLVVNLNVSTLGHRDRFDKDFCLVLPLGDFKGGALESVNQDEVTMSAAELQSMKTELERLRKAEHMEANKAAEAQRKIEFRKLAAHRLSQEIEEEESSQPSSPKCIRRNLPTEDDVLDEDEEALARKDQSQEGESERLDKSNECVSNTEDDQESRGENGEEGNNNGIIEVSEEGPPTGKHKRSPNGTRKEQVTLSILEKSVRDLAIAGHDYLRMYIATQNTFPDSTTKSSFSWKRLEEAVASRKELKQLMEQESKMWKGVSSMRGTVANKARETIGDALGLSGMKRDDIAEAVEWMLKDLKKVRKGGEGDEDISLPFISGDLDIKNKTFNRNKPFGNHFFLHMYRLFFIGNNPDGVRYIQYFRNSPLPLLALIAIVMECTLSCWETGVFIKKDFRDAYYKPKYQFYLCFLKNLQEKAPRWTMKMREEMYQNVLEESNMTYLLHIEDDGEGDRWQWQAGG
ncbi:hypothetical protein DFH29DRAFT_1001957 [Suillus ampliporus]|nr:hypothetical protein DFH29DRAFT_1001957 [Suillus ampliporus]